MSSQKKTKGMTIKGRLWLLTGLLIANVAVTGGVAMWNAGQLEAQLAKVASIQLPASNYLSDIDGYHDLIRSNVYRSLISSDPETIEAAYNEYVSSAEQIDKALAELDALPVPAATHEAIKGALADLKGYKALSFEVIELAAKGQRRDAFMKIPDFEKEFSSTNEKLQVIAKLGDETTTAITQEGKVLADRSKIFNAGLVALSILLGLGMALFLIRAIVKAMGQVMTSLNGEIVSLTRSATHLQGASTQLAEATTEQSAAIEETAASIEEISAMISQTAQNAYGTLEETKGGQETASAGRDVVARLVRAMGDIQDSNDKLGKIIKLIEEIRNKTKVINDIAFETRLLSFNASIEAARAGSHGKGFAVVAEEVGKLASVSGKAADEIRALLESSIAEVSEIVDDTRERVNVGQDISKQCETTFTGMGGSLSRIADAVNMIASAAKEQETGVKQTNTAMTEMDKVTQRNSRSAETLAAQVTALMGASVNLKSTISRLQLMLTGQELELDAATSTDSVVATTPTIAPASTASTAVELPRHAGQPANLGEAPAAPGIPADGPQIKGAATESVSRNDSRWRAA